MLKRFLINLFGLLVLMTCCHGDLYLHNPRGSNNRFDEKSANRRNPHRLFDSQNNNRGGYNVGDTEGVSDEKDAPSYHNDDTHIDEDNVKKHDGSKSVNEETHETPSYNDDNDDGDTYDDEDNVYVEDDNQIDEEYYPSSNDDYFDDHDDIHDDADYHNDDDTHDEQDNDNYDKVESREANDAQTIDEGQYRMTYFASETGENGGETFLIFEFTVQHGCGSENGKVIANIIGQYRCDSGYEPENEVDKKLTLLNQLRNGNEIKNSGQSRSYDRNTGKTWEKFVEEYEKFAYDYPMHESFYEYYMCRQRERNRGVFDADYLWGRHTSHHTRQNVGGHKFGMECPEERDYYPHWCPTKWIDAFYVGSETVDKLEEKFAAHSNNVKPRGMCVENFKKENGEEVTDSIFMKIRHEITQDYCESRVDSNGNYKTPGIWREYYTALEVFKDLSEEECKEEGKIWDYTLDNMREKVCFTKPPPMEFHQAKFCQENHNGNANKKLEMMRIKWKIPAFENDNKHCVFRMRYNITTADYDAKTTTKNNMPIVGETGMLEFTREERDENNRNKVAVHIGSYEGEEQSLEINRNTAQFGRTFQDRTHVFKVIQRPRELKNKKKTIYNLNVRGKRGNIVQVYPAVEYDFVPNELNVQNGDCIHIQWTGSNTHNNGNSGGDGQTGDAGQGRSGTDRHNFVCIDQLNRNFPVRESKALELCFSKVKSVYYVKDKTFVSNMDTKEQRNLAVFLAYSGFYKNHDDAANPNTDKVDVNLNKASPSFEGVVIEMTEGCTINFMCSRNNNFSNRSQQGKITSGTSSKK